MQDRYAGDIGDYGKFGLLKALQAEGFRLGINWYKATPPTKKEKENEDGKHRIAERYDACDPVLAETLRAISTSPQRSIEALQQAALLDAARTVYFREEVTVAGRAQWHEDALQALADCDLVFLDPDNGLLVKSVGRRSAKSVKYVFDEELNDYLARGQSVVLYNHRARKPAVQYFQELADRCAALPAAQGKPICALTFPKGTIRDYLLIAATPDHAHRIHQALNHMTQGAWANLGLCHKEAVVLMAGGRVNNGRFRLKQQGF